MSGLEVVRTGPLMLLEDAGRKGLLSLGVSTSGAFDQRRARAANAAVGNPPDAAVLEVLLGGARLRAVGEVVLAVCGPAPAEVVRGIGDGPGEPAGECRPVVLNPADELRLGSPAWGLRTYVAMAGGFAAEPVLGSRSRDQLSGLGPDPIRPGQVLLGGDRAVPVVSSVPAPAAPTSSALEVGFLPGPRMDRLEPGELERMCSQPWQVSPHSDRTGIRLTGTRLNARAGELPSEAALPGAIQLPPSGEPIIFGPDHPVTGGYPVIGVVTRLGLSELAQARPGYHLRLRLSGPLPTPHG